MRLNGTPHGSVLADVRPSNDEYVEYNWPNDSEDMPGRSRKARLQRQRHHGRRPGLDAAQGLQHRPYPGTHSPENYRFYFNPTLRIDEDVFDPLILLLKTMDRTTTPSEYDAKLEQILNVEASLRVYAVRALWPTGTRSESGTDRTPTFTTLPSKGGTTSSLDMDHTCEQRCRHRSG